MHANTIYCDGIEITRGCFLNAHEASLGEEARPWFQRLAAYLTVCLAVSLCIVDPGVNYVCAVLPYWHPKPKGEVWRFEDLKI